MVKHLGTAVIIAAALCAIVLAQDEKSSGTGRIVLKVNKQEVSRSEFDKLFFESRAREFMEQLIDQMLIEQKAGEKGISVTQEEVEERLEETLLQELASCQNDMVKLKEKFSLYGYSLEERRKAGYREARILLLAEKLVKSTRTAEDSLKELFKNRYGEQTGRVVKAYHILVSTGEVLRYIESRIAHLKLQISMAPEARKDKLRLEMAKLKEKQEKWKGCNSRSIADTVVKKLKAGGNFAGLAKEYGAGYTSEYYDLGWVSSKNVFKLLVPALFEQLKPGEVAEPIQSRFGFHIVKLMETKDASKLKYEDVRPYLLNEMESRHADRHEVEHLTKHLREEARIERNLLDSPPPRESDE